MTETQKNHTDIVDNCESNHNPPDESSSVIRPCRNGINCSIFKRWRFKNQINTKDTNHCIYFSHTSNIECRNKTKCSIFKRCKKGTGTSQDEIHCIKFNHLANG